jgi:hypothetical protein
MFSIGEDMDGEKRRTGRCHAVAVEWWDVADNEKAEGWAE